MFAKDFTTSKHEIQKKGVRILDEYLIDGTSHQRI